MGLQLPVKIQATITLVDVHTLRCEIDTTKVPSIGLAIAMLEKALRTLKTEEANQQAVLFGERMVKEQVEAAMASALTNPRKQ